MDRRSFLRAAVLSSGAFTFGRGFWQAAYAAPVQPGASPYGPLLEADANGMMLPEGFTSRVLATSGQPVGSTGYVWHTFPDGAATYPKPDGGFYYAVNSEVPGVGGVGAIDFGPDGEILDAYRILSGTSQNCAGGPTPWGTWLSCEEFDFSGQGGPAGRVWECDPSQPGQGVVKPALGAFSHEAVAIDPDNGVLYLTEDQSDGRFYRFTPDAYPNLDAGLLEVAVVADDGATTWAEVPDPDASTGPTRLQVPESRAFDGGEGIWFDRGYVYFTTKGTNRVWVLDIARQRITILYDANELTDPPLTGVDNVTVAPSGDLLVAEDGGNLEINIITADTRAVAPIMRLTSPEHEGSEITGPVFSPDGSRLYFSSQRGGGGQGVTFEVTGPFRTERVGIAAEAAEMREPGPAASPSPEPDASEQPDPAPQPTDEPQPAPAGDASGGEELPATGGGLAAAGLGATAAAAALRRMARSDEPQATPDEDAAPGA